MLETRRLILRPFRSEDVEDVLELALDWRKAPGPEFDKWPTTRDAVKDFTDYLAREDKYFAISLRDTKKVVGLLGLNGIDDHQQLDLGHVILSKYQDGDHDKEALAAMVAHAFATKDVASIVTRNESAHTAQLAPLRALGFRSTGTGETGEMMMTKAEWESAKR